MSLFIASLNSGSNGNCYYIGNQQEAVLIDAGLSCRETERRMKRIGLCMQKVKAIFISHEHTDHISGLRVLSTKYQLPVYITRTTLASGRAQVPDHLTVPFTAGIPVAVGNLLVHAFIKHHDACDPHSFSITGNGITIGVFTDIGQPCTELTSHFNRCHAAFLEANYDTDMLMNGRYPYFLKARISGGKGHLSNAQALQVFLEHKPSFMSHVLLAHLSKDNNDPEKVEQLFRSHAGDVKVIVASRFQETDVYQIGNNIGNEPIVLTRKTQQLALL